MPSLLFNGGYYMYNPFRSFEDVLSSLRANLLPVKANAEKTDRILKSTKLDDNIYADLRTGDTDLDDIEKAATEKLKTFPALSQDIFQSFYSLAQRRNPEGQLSAAAREFNARLLENVTEQDDYLTLKNVCEGRELLAYEAAGEFISRTADDLDSLLQDIGGDKGFLRTLEKLETSADEAAEKLSELAEQVQSTRTPSEPLKKELIAAANQYAKKQRQVDAVSKIIGDAMLRKKDEISDTVSVAVHAAKEKAEEVSNIISSWSDDPADMRKSPMNIELLEKVRKSPALRDISRYLGKFREIFAQGRKNGYTYGRGETYSLELGNDLGRALTSELSMLAMPQTIPLFLRKVQQKQIKQYRRREPSYKGMGDIICCLDESGSTEGDPAAWGKAVAMTLLEIAAESKRKFALVHFAGSQRCQVDLFLPGEYSIEDKLRASETFLDGGTNFERPLTEALELMENHGFENADIVFITDGVCSVSEEFTEMLCGKQAERHFTVTGILLDKGQDLSFSLSPFCQNIYRTSELSGDDIVRSVISNIAM